MLTKAGGRDAFAGKLSGAGAFAWGRLMGASVDDHGYTVGVDAAGNAYFTGNYTGTYDFGGGALPSANGGGTYLVSYDSAGMHRWSKTIGSDGFLSVTDQFMDPWGILVMTGQLTGTVDFGNGVTTTNATQGIFSAKLTEAGTSVWSHGYLGGSSLAVTSSPAGEVFLLGDFYGSMDFGNGPIMSSSVGDFYVAKLMQ